MSATLKFDFQKTEQLRFSEVNYLNYTKKPPILHVATTFSLKQRETRTSHGPIPHPLKFVESGLVSACCRPGQGSVCKSPCPNGLLASSFWRII